MDFSFTSEQDDLRREARTFLEANPAPSQEQLEQLGWVGVVDSESFVASEVGDDRRAQLAAHALEAVGIGSRAVELAVAYIGEREQFGKKIGTYQAVSHPVVDAYVAVELGRSLAYWAALCVTTDDPQADAACAAANAQATEAAVRACETSIQVHGGIGFTFEHPLHRYYKRALELEGALGYGRELRAEIASFLLSS
jgi:alkylation response protein AidB-like acyl-CoA dehydrogenase